MHCVEFLQFLYHLFHRYFFIAASWANSTTPPVADPNGPYTETVGVEVLLDGSTSYDPDGSIILWEWDLDEDGTCDDATGETVGWTYGVCGEYVVTLKVTDEAGITDTESTTVSIGCGNQPPDCDQASPSIMSAWPPNKKFIDVNVLGVTDPDGDPLIIVIYSIYQDEPVDGKFAPDGQGIGTSTATVRAERDGSGNGRVYHITFDADDGNGGTCSGEVFVSVPHDQSGAPAVDDGAAYDSTDVTP